MLRQNCPACDRMLELPDFAAGKTAKCPACQAEFNVPGGTGADPVHGGAVVAPTGTSSQPGDGSDGPPMSEGESPFSRPLGGGPAGDGGGAYRPAPLNPYQPSISTHQATIGELNIGSRSVEEIFGVSFAIFKERWPTLIGGYVLVFAISIVAAFGPQLVTMVFGRVADANVTMVMSGIATLFFNLLSFYFTLGFVAVTLAIARNESSPLSKLTPPLTVFGRFLAGVIVIGLASMIVVAVFALIAGAVITVGAGQAVAAGLILLAVVVLLPIIFVMYWLLWSWAYILVDEKADWIGSIKASYAVTMQNKMTSLLLLIITMMMSLAGALACYVGLLVATPLWMLMLAVGYLMITDQPLSDPRARLRTDFEPRPSSPTF